MMRILVATDGSPHAKRAAELAARLSPHDVGLQLLENTIATVAALVSIILAVGPVSGAHLNPVVTLAH